MFHEEEKNPTKCPFLCCISQMHFKSKRKWLFRIKVFFCIFFWPHVEVSPLLPEILQFYTMILQRLRIIVEDVGFEPGTSVPEVWRATKEPPHLLGQEPPHLLSKSHHISGKELRKKIIQKCYQYTGVGRSSSMLPGSTASTVSATCS